MMNKMIHANEFRLRMLLTNKCNKKCFFCLNDFQPKKPIQYADTLDVVDCLRAYGAFMKSKKEESIVTFSGGEPGLHNSLELILTYAKYYCDVVKVVTNGTALNAYYTPLVDSWHVGVTSVDTRIVDFSNYVDKLIVQIVVADDMDVSYLYDMVYYYQSHGIRVKLFSDFYTPNPCRVREIIEHIQKSFPSVCTRFTGLQVNRGKACEGCIRDCVTLKALWYFPDGTSSTCPQRRLEPYDDDSWDETVEKAYEAHKI